MMKDVVRHINNDATNSMGDIAIQMKAYIDSVKQENGLARTVEWIT